MTLWNRLLPLLLVFSGFLLIHCDISCDQTDPHNELTSQDKAFELSFHSDNYSKNQFQEVTLRGDVTSFVGFRLAAWWKVQGKWQPAGQFYQYGVDSWAYKTASCSNVNDSMVNLTTSSFWSMTAVWMPPSLSSTKRADNDVIFYAAVLSYDGQFSRIKSAPISRSELDYSAATLTCQDVEPFSVDTFPLQPQFQLDFSSQTFSSNPTLYVRLRHISPSTARFDKFIIRALDASYNSVGRFELADSEDATVQSTDTCGNGTIVATSSVMRESIAVFYFPPSSYESSLQFIASLVDENDLRHRGLYSAVFQFSNNEQTTINNQHNSFIPCDGAVPTAVNSTRYSITVNTGTGSNKYDWSLPVLVNLTSEKGSFTSFLIRAFNSGDQSVGSFLSSTLSADQNFELSCTNNDGINGGALTSIRLLKQTSVFWVAPVNYTENVRFIAAVDDFHTSSRHVISSDWIPASFNTQKSIACEQTTALSEIFPRAHSFALVTNVTFYRGSETINVSLVSLESFPHMAFMIRAIDQDNKAIGTFQSSPTSSVLVQSCGDVTGDAVTSASSAPQMMSTVIFTVPNPAPLSLRFLATAVSQDGRHYTGIRSDVLHQTNDSRYVLPCDVFSSDRPIPGDQFYRLTVTDMFARSKNSYDQNQPFYVTLSATESAKSFIHFRIRAFNDWERGYGTFSVSKRYNASTSSSLMTIGRCVSPNDTLVSTLSAGRRSVTAEWTAPSSGADSLKIRAAVMDSEGNTYTVETDWLKFTGNAPMVTCNASQPGVEPFPVEVTDYFLETGKFDAQNTFQHDEHFSSGSSISVVLRSNGGRYFGDYNIRAFDDAGRPYGMFKPVPKQDSSTVTCQRDNDTATPNYMSRTRIKAEAVWIAPLGSTSNVFFFAALADTYDERLYMGIQTTAWWRPKAVNEPTSNNSFIECNSVEPDYNPGNETNWFIVQKANENTTSYDLNSPLTVTLNFAGGIAPFWGFRIVAINSRRQSTGTLTPYQAAGDGFTLRTEVCQPTSISPLKSIRNHGNFFNWKITVQWEATDDADYVQFIGAIVDANGKLVTNIRSEIISPEVSPPAILTCERTGLFEAPFHAASHFHLTASLNGTSNFPRLVNVILSTDDSSVYPFTGYMIRAFDERDVAASGFVSSGGTKSLYQCMYPNDTVLIEAVGGTSFSTVAVQFVPASTARALRFAASVLENDRISTGIHSSWLNVTVINNESVQDNPSKLAWENWCDITTFYTPSSGTFEFSLELSDYVYKDGVPIHVSVQALGFASYKGFMIRAFDANGNSVGGFSESAYSSMPVRFVTCSQFMDSVTNSTSSLKYNRTAQWRNDGQLPRKVIFVATVLDYEDTLHRGIQSKWVEFRGSAAPSSQLSCTNTTLFTPTSPPAPNFYFNISATQFTVTQPLYVSIVSRSIPFVGFLLRVFDDKYSPVGVFTHTYMHATAATQLFQCAHYKDAIMNASASYRWNETVMWTSPLAPPTMVQFVASIQDYMGLVTTAIKSDWIYLTGAKLASNTSHATPYETMCSETEPRVKTDPYYPPFVVERDNGSYTGKKNTAHVMLVSYGKTAITWFMIRAFDAMQNPIGSFEASPYLSFNSGTSVEYFKGELVDCETSQDALMTDMSERPRRLVTLTWYTMAEKLPNEIMFVATVKDNAGNTYQAVKSKWITLDNVQITGSSTRASAGVLLALIAVTSAVMATCLH